MNHNVPTQRQHDDDGPGFTLHMDLAAPDLPTATTLARMVAALAQQYPQALVGTTSVSASDAQSIRRKVFCDRRMRATGDDRCGLRAEHLGPHAAVQPVRP